MPIIVEQNLDYKHPIFVNQSQGYYMTYIDGIVKNPSNGKRTPLVHKFLVDTGAAISIFNKKLQFLLDEKTPVIGHVNIFYGGGKRKAPLPVYNMTIKIKGEEFHVKAAFDNKLKYSSVLGHFGFLNDITHFGISKKRRKFRIVK